MEISPYMLTLLLIYSFLFGISAGILNDINRIARIFLGEGRPGKSFERLYEIELPLVGKLARNESKRGAGKWGMVLFIFLQDIFLFGYLGCGTVILNFYLNRGQFRLYTIAAVAAGFAIYYFTLGKIVIFVSQALIFFIRAVLKISFYLISRPFVFFGKILLKIFSPVREKISSAIAKRKIIRYNKSRQGEVILPDSEESEMPRGG